MSAISHLKKWFPLIIIFVLIAASYAFGIGDYLNFETIKTHRETLLEFVHAHFLLSIGLYFLAYVAVVSLSLPFATVLTLLSGFLFGVGIGGAIVVSAATLGATIIFLIARSSFGAFLRDKAKGKYYARTEKEFKANDIQYLLFIRLAPIFPFAIVNILPALFNMSTKRYVIATFFGIMPGSLVYVYTGQSLSDIDRLSDLASPALLTAFFLLSLLALLPRFIKTIKNRSKSNVQK